MYVRCEGFFERKGVLRRAELPVLVERLKHCDDIYAGQSSSIPSDPGCEENNGGRKGVDELYLLLLLCLAMYNHLLLLHLLLSPLHNLLHQTNPQRQPHPSAVDNRPRHHLCTTLNLEVGLAGGESEGWEEMGEGAVEKGWGQ
jgi:hypothetical protein